MKISRAAGSSVLLLALLFASGCSSAQTSNTARTAREQLLISNAIDQSLAKVNFSSLAGANVFLEEKYMDSVDKPYIVGSLRHHVLRSGGSLVDKAEDADVIMEARSGGVGTDMSEKFVGIPEIALPGLLSIPEIRFAENKAQQGYAKIEGLPEKILAKLKAQAGFMPLNSKSDPQAIYDLFGVSKKSFKAAIGALYKERLITIEENGIRLV